MLAAFERESAAIPHGKPSLAVISNVSGTRAAADAFSGAYWARHAGGTVGFADGIRALYDMGSRIFVECGPQPTLIALGMQSITDPDVTWVPSLRQNEHDWTRLTRSLAALFAAGLPID